MRPEVVLACLTLCVVEAGSSHKRRHLTTALFGNSFRLASKPQTSIVEAVTNSGSQGRSGDVIPDANPSAVAFLHSLTSGSHDAARELQPIFSHKHHDRSQFLRQVLRQATQQFINTRLTSAITKRQMMMKPVDKRRSRYKCDFSRVTIQMILEYFRTRRICGYRVNRMRFGLGGK